MKNTKDLPVRDCVNICFFTKTHYVLNEKVGKLIYVNTYRWLNE